MIRDANAGPNTIGKGVLFEADPATGRFLNEDSWGLSAGDTNFYRYVGNQPTEFIDPSGHVAASTYAAMISGIIFTVVDVDFSCFTESAMVFSVGVGIPYTDVHQEMYSADAKGGGIPTPAGLDVQIMSCALLSFAAWSNGVFAQFSTVLSLLSQSQSDSPRDCTIYRDTRAYNSVTDYSVFVRASCGGGDNPFYITNNDERLEIHTGYNDDPHSNCFIAGTHVLVVQEDEQVDSAQETVIAAGTWTPLFVGLVGVAATLGLSKPSATQMRRKNASDDFWDSFEADELLWDDPIEPTPIPRASVAAHKRELSADKTELVDLIDDQLIDQHEPRENIEISNNGIPTRASGMSKLTKWALACLFMLACALPMWKSNSTDSVAGIEANASSRTTSLSIAPKPIESIESIESIRPGDTVLAWDEQLGIEIPRKVLRVFRNSTDHIHQITITGSDGDRQTIGTTCTHPFWVVGEGWTDASELEVGDSLQEPGGKISFVSGHETEFSEEGIATFNFEVEGSHTYFAAATSSDDAVLVHNMSKRPRSKKRGKNVSRNSSKRKRVKTSSPEQCTPKRRKQTAGDADFPNESAARREALRRNNVPTSQSGNTTVTPDPDSRKKNSNLSGPNGEPSDLIQAQDAHGNNVTIPHHKWGHQFKDNNTFEHPHFQGPNGEHLSYPPRS